MSPSVSFSVKIGVRDLDTKLRPRYEVMTKIRM